jgi:hypothetical protein
MAKTKRKGRGRWFKKRRGHKDNRIPILPTLGIINYGVNVLSAGGKRAVLEKGDIEGYMKWVFKDALMYGTGYDLTTGRWNWSSMMSGTIPILLGAVGSKVMTAIGVNRYMKKIPMIGKRIKL